VFNQTVWGHKNVMAKLKDISQILIRPFYKCDSPAEFLRIYRWYNLEISGNYYFLRISQFITLPYVPNKLGSSGNAYDLCSGGAGFESRPGHRIFWDFSLLSPLTPRKYVNTVSVRRIMSSFLPSRSFPIRYMLLSRNSTWYSTNYLGKKGEKLKLSLCLTN
jgi:hypothetical protein